MCVWVRLNARVCLLWALWSDFPVRVRFTAGFLGDESGYLIVQPMVASQFTVSVLMSIQSNRWSITLLSTRGIRLFVCQMHICCALQEMRAATKYILNGSLRSSVVCCANDHDHAAIKNNLEGSCSFWVVIISYNVWILLWTCCFVSWLPDGELIKQRPGLYSWSEKSCKSVNCFQLHIHLCKYRKLSLQAVSSLYCS